MFWVSTHRLGPVNGWIEAKAQIQLKWGWLGLIMPSPKTHDSSQKRFVAFLSFNIDNQSTTKRI